MKSDGRGFNGSEVEERGGKRLCLLNFKVPERSLNFQSSLN